jgi:hypothetical protein
MLDSVTVNLWENLEATSQVNALQALVEIVKFEGYLLTSQSPYPLMADLKD